MVEPARVTLPSDSPAAPASPPEGDVELAAKPPAGRELGVVVWKVPLMGPTGQEYVRTVRCHWDPEKVNGDEIVRVAVIEAGRDGIVCAPINGRPPELQRDMIAA